MTSPIPCIIDDLRSVVERLDSFYTADEARLWFDVMHPLLDGARAIDLINQGCAEAVLAVIDRLESAAFI